MTKHARFIAFEPHRSDLARPFCATGDERAATALGYFRLTYGQAAAGNICANGAQKYQISPFTPEAPQDGLDPKSETVKLRTVSREERN
jgi:hypothetical protein